MNLYDFLIIYFACGAPVGVYYFLQNRHRSNRQKLLLKTFLAFTAWMPFALRYLTKNRFFQNRFDDNFGGEPLSDSALERKVQTAKTRLEKALFEADSNISIYEVREIFDRYVSFTLSRQIDNRHSHFALKDNEIFRVAGHSNSRLAAICRRRRNRRQIIFHQTLARRDFLNLFAGKPKFEAAAIEFVSLLKDLEAKDAIEKMFNSERQRTKAPFVKDAEKQLWNSETHKPAFTKMISTPLKATTATASLRGKD
jgi:hypothetical protein